MNLLPKNAYGIRIEFDRYQVFRRKDNKSLKEFETVLEAKNYINKLSAKGKK